MKAAQERGLMPSTGVGVGILASILLGLLTLSVFFVLQDYGPESAIRKYNEAVLNGDLSAVDQISAQPSTSVDGQWMLAQVRYFLGKGSRLRLVDMQRSPDKCVAWVEYVTPQPPTYHFLFVVQKDNHVWRISPTATSQMIEYVQQHGS